MPILQIPLTDTFGQWRQKDNEMIALVNSLAHSGDVISSSGPIAGQILVYDGTFYRNVTMSGDIEITSSGSTTVVGGASAVSKGRQRFIGSMSSLY